jgi:hypothetical protein
MLDSILAEAGEKRGVHGHLWGNGVKAVLERVFWVVDSLVFIVGVGHGCSQFVRRVAENCCRLLLFVTYCSSSLATRCHLLLDVTYCSMSLATRCHLLPDVTCYSMSLATRCHLLLDVTCCHLPRMSLATDVTCYGCHLLRYVTCHPMSLAAAIPWFSCWGLW